MTTPRVVRIKKDVLAKNDELATANRRYFSDQGIDVYNLLSSPGAGKTTLLARTLRELDGDHRCAVIEGDQETDNDAATIAATGVPVTQINTVSACHLDAAMVQRALDGFDLTGRNTLFIENIGNLVCPASYDLGEKAKVALMSVTEGEDKPVKYPKMFRVASAVVITKIDLLPYLDYDIVKAIAFCKATNPDSIIMQVSAKTGEGLAAWYDYLKR